MIRISVLVLLASQAIAVAQEQAPQPGGNFFGSVLPMMLIMFVIIYFLMIRPEQKKQKDRQKMIAAVSKGDRIVSIGGILGTVGNVKESTITVKTGESTVVEIRRTAIAEVITEKNGSDKKEDGKK